MKANVTVKVDIDGLMKQLGSLDAAVQKKVLRQAAAKGGDAAAKTAQTKCPVRDTEAMLAATRRRAGAFRIAFEGVPGLSNKRVKDYRGGLLKKSIGKKIKFYKNTGTHVAIVGPRTGFRKQIGVVTRGKNKGKPIYADPRKYAHLVIKGTRHSRPNDFMTPAQNRGAKVMYDAASGLTDQAIAEAAKG